MSNDLVRRVDLVRHMRTEHFWPHDFNEEVSEETLRGIHDTDHAMDEGIRIPHNHGEE